MFKNLNIQNFRLFRDFQVDGLAPVNLFVGKNNVGKTALLEGIHLLARQDEVSTILGTFFQLSKVRRELVFEFDGRATFRLNHFFLDHSPKKNPKIFIKAETDQNIPLKLWTKYISDDKDRESPLNDLIELSASWLSAIYEYPANLTGNITVDQRIIERPLSNAISHFITTKGIGYQELAALWDSIQLTPYESDVIEMLQVIESTVERIAFQTSATNILVKLKDKPPTYLGSLGDGMHRILSMSMALASVKNGYLLIDEIDTGLHYRTLTDMWRLILTTAKRLNIQVFATTHSEDCVRSFAEALSLEEEKDVGALFRLQRRGEEIQAVRYDADRLIFAVEQDIEVR